MRARVHRQSWFAYHEHIVQAPVEGLDREHLLIARQLHHHPSAHHQRVPLTRLLAGRHIAQVVHLEVQGGIAEKQQSS